MRPLRASPAAAAALVLTMAGLSVWRGACIAAGPDIDTDAYAHHMIARAILADPGDLAVHWVWLPLFHYAQVPLVALGGTMNAVRWANLLFSTALPCVLFGYLRRTVRSGEADAPPDAVALVAAVVAGACPIAMQMGTTAQPEPLFALLVLGCAIAFERRDNAVAAVLLGAAVMLRYEAWAVLAAAAGVLALGPAWRRWRRQDAPRPEIPAAKPRVDGPSAWLVVALPLVLIGGWAVLRRPVDGRWFGFLGQTHEFAAGSIHEPSLIDRGFFAVIADVLYYPLVVPVRVLGPVLAFAPFGVRRAVRQQGPRFVLVFAACLAFVSLSWVMRSCLGLDRHFVSVVPLYATFVAQGAAAVADWAARTARRLVPHARAERESGRQLNVPQARADRESGRTRDRPSWRAPAVGRAVGGGLVLLALAGLGIELAVWMGFWRESIARGLPDRAGLGAYLRSIPEASTVFCDDATLEISSGLDRRRFDRHWVDNPQTWQRVEELARSGRGVYVATWRRKLRGHEKEGSIVFRAGYDPADADSTGVAVMRVEADGDHSER